MIPHDRIRAAALVLPETDERDGAFLVAGETFAAIDSDRLRVRDGDGWAEMSIGDETDWPLVEDRIARAWELTAPRRLLEAGGR